MAVPADRRPTVPFAVVLDATPADAEAIQQMHARCSVGSRAERWRSPLREVPARYLDDAVTGHNGHVTVAAWDGPRCVGFADAVRTDADGGEHWELGVLVEDDVQRAGVGTRLVQALVHRLPPPVLLVADVRAERPELVRALSRLGPSTVRGAADELRVSVEVSPAGARRLHLVRP